MKKKMCAYVSICLAVLVTLISLIVCYESKNGVILEYRMKEGVSRGDMQFILRKNKTLVANFGLRGAARFQKKNFLRETYSTKEIVLSQEDYDTILRDIELLVNADVQLEEELYECTNDGIIDVFLYNGKVYVADSFFYMDDKQFVNSKDLVAANREIRDVLCENAYPDNPIF